MNQITILSLYQISGYLLISLTPCVSLLCALRIPSDHNQGILLQILNYQGEVLGLVTSHVSYRECILSYLESTVTGDRYWPRFQGYIVVYFISTILRMYPLWEGQILAHMVVSVWREAQVVQLINLANDPVEGSETKPYYPHYEDWSKSHCLIMTSSTCWTMKSYVICILFISWVSQPTRHESGIACLFVQFVL